MRLGDRLWCWLRQLGRTFPTTGPLVIQVGDHKELLWIDGHDWAVDEEDVIRCRTCDATDGVWRRLP